MGATEFENIDIPVPVHIKSGLVTLQSISGTGVLVQSGLSVLLRVDSVVEARSPREVSEGAGTRFSVTDIDASVGNTSGDEKYWFFRTPNSALRAKIEFHVGVGDEALIELRENPTVCSAAGNVLVIYNKDRNSSTSSTVLVWEGYGVSYGTGTTIAAVQTASDGSREDMGDSLAGKWELKQNEDYALVITMANAATPASMYSEWTEE